MTSHSIYIGPTDHRCRHWAKIVRSGRALPMPENVKCAADIPVPYRSPGHDELMPGDVLFEGEALHHCRNLGRAYSVVAVSLEGTLMTLEMASREFKAAMKREGGFDPDLLRGSGDLAACVRFAHIARLGGLQNLRAKREIAEASAAIDGVLTLALVAQTRRKVGNPGTPLSRTR